MAINDGNDMFNGNSYMDILHAGSGNDVLNGNGGADMLYGDSGADILWGDAGSDYLDGGTGYDTAAFLGYSWEYSATRSGSDVTITDKFGLDGSDYTTGIEAFSFEDGIFTFDQLFPTPVVLPPAPVPPAEPALNHMYGTMGNDRIVGTAGDDMIWSLGGKDILTGGAGNDSFIFAKPGKKNVDTIKDFSKTDDYLALDNAFFKGVGNGPILNSSAFHSNNTGLAHDSNDRIIQDKNSGKIYYDADGTGSKAGILIANIQPNLKLAHTDFLVF
jgi:Ca2+-binding RTX toxin-like protein